MSEPNPNPTQTLTPDADGDRISLSVPYGCDPGEPVSPPDGCVGWSGFTDKGNFSMGSVDGQQHVMILLNGTGTFVNRVRVRFRVRIRLCSTLT